MALAEPRAVLAALLGAVVLHACAQVLGIDGDYGDLPGADASNMPPDASSDAGDGAASDGAALDQVVDMVTDRISLPCDTAPSTCVAALPEGWELVLLTPDRNLDCPTEFAQHDVVAEAVAGAGACDCACAVGSGPTCTMGRMSTRYGTTTSCTSPGASINVNGSGCTPLAGSFSSYFSGTPLPATVTCDASAVIDRTTVTSSELRVCDVPSACREEVCAGDVPAVFSACVASPGDVTCPAGWDTRTVVGESAELSCTPCTCQASASCTDTRISFFSDAACGEPLVAFDVDDTCQSTNGATSISAFTYTATVSDAACAADGPKTPTVDLVATRTVCCK
jgi:hypothetical protein